MTLRITGGQTFLKPDAERGLQDMMAHAKKQFQETGSLEGFSEEYTSSSAEGIVKISISSIAAALYDKSAGEDDYILAFKVDSKAVDELGGGAVGGGSTTTIKNAEEIDAFSRQTIDLYDDMRWAKVIDGTPEEIEAYFANELAKDRAQPGHVELTATGANNAPAVPGAETSTKKATEEPNSKLAKAQAQNETAGQLVAKLKDFLDGLMGKSKETQDSTAKGTDDNKSVQTALSRLLTRVNTTA